MEIKNREDSIEELAEVLNKEQLSTILSHNYSDKALSVMSEFDRGYIEFFVDTQYSTESMEKVIGAYADKLIDWKDLLHIAEYSCYDYGSENYVDRFIQAIENKELDHTTAARILIATVYERDTYDGVMELVKSGAYITTPNGGIGLNHRIAAELRELGVPLTAMRKDGTYYDLTQKSEFDEAIKNGDRIKLRRFPMLAVKVNQLIATPDWEDFKDWFADHQGIDRKNLNAMRLREQYIYFSRESYADKLVSKVADEYDFFIDDMKKRSPEEIIKSAYEIVIKEQIKMYMVEVPQIIPEQKTDALMSSRNTLNDIYEQWRSDDDFESTDIEAIVENTADKIIAAKEREQKLAAELAKKSVPSDAQQDKPHFKPHKNTRR